MKKLYHNGDINNCRKMVNTILQTISVGNYDTSKITKLIISLLKEIDSEYDDSLIYNFFENYSDAFKLLPYGYYVNICVTDIKNSTHILRSPLEHFNYKVYVSSDKAFSFHYESSDLITNLVICSLHALKDKINNS